MPAASGNVALDQATALLSELEEQLSHGPQHVAAKASPLPSAHQLFTIGSLLYQIQHSTTLSSSSSSSSIALTRAYRQLVKSLPDSYWKQLMGKVYCTALAKLLQQYKHSKSLDDLISYANSLSGLISNAPERLCPLSYSPLWISRLSQLYDIYMVQSQDATTKESVLSVLSFFMLDGLLATSKAIEEDLLNMIQPMEEESIDCLRDLQAWQRQSEPHQRILVNYIQNLPNPENDDSDILQQREYLLSMLETARQAEVSTATVRTTTTSTPKKATNSKPAATSKPVNAADEVERRILQVQQILPDLGQGFIETALSIHQGNVETTVAVLLNDPSRYPVALRLLDTQLPRRKKERTEDEILASREARQLVKERVAVQEEQEQTKYKALLYMETQQRESEEAQQLVARHNEYDDDYDDQYDEIDVKLGGADEGMYDFEQVKLYNQTVRAEEAEGSFWEDSRNTNRTQQVGQKKGKNANGEKQYRGPDKIKGGRIIGPDGKVVRNQKRGKPNNNNQSNQRNNNNSNKNANNTGGGPSKGGGPQQQPQGDNPPGQQKKKGGHRTKPKANNRVNRQRDKKQKAQGNFGASS